MPECTHPRKKTRPLNSCAHSAASSFASTSSAPPTIFRAGASTAAATASVCAALLDDAGSVLLAACEAGPALGRDGFSSSLMSPLVLASSSSPESISTSPSLSLDACLAASGCSSRMLASSSAT